MTFVLWRMFTNHITNLYDEQFSASTLPLPLYKKKSYTIPDVLALTNILNPHFTGFSGLYGHIPLLLVLAGIDLFIDYHNVFRLHFQTICLYHFKQWSNIEQFIMLIFVL